MCDVVFEDPVPTASAFAGGWIAWNGLNGLRPPRSKIDPRSTKNGSSRGPAKASLLPRGW